MFYDKFEALCSEKGVSKQKACMNCGLSRTAWNKWKTGAIPNGEAVQAFANYFQVSTDYLLKDAETKKAPTQEGERINESQIKAAFFHGSEISPEEMDEYWNDAKEYVKFKIEQRKRRNEK